MQTLIKATLAAALGMAAVSPALAGEQAIVVHSPAAMQAWSESVNGSLDRRLRQASRIHKVNPASGVVQLRFTIDADGKPQEMTVQTSTGDSRTDKLAMRAVRALPQLGDAPVRDLDQQTFQANIIFAQNRDEYARLAEKLAKSERARLARGGAEAQVLAFGS